MVRFLRCAELRAGLPESSCNKHRDTLKSQPHVFHKRAPSSPTDPHTKHTIATVPRTRIQWGQAPALTFPNKVRWTSSRVFLFVMCHIASPSSYHGRCARVPVIGWRYDPLECSKPWGRVYLFHTLTPLVGFRS